MHLLASIISVIESYQTLGYWVVFLASFLEALAFVGGLIPGATIVVLIAFTASRGYFDVFDLIWIASLGAILGDGVSYYLGTKGTKFFKNENRFLKESHLELGKKFFAKHGSKSIFLGRFIGLLRPMVPFVAGLIKMNIGRFIFWNIISGITWAVAHIYLGYFFGGAIKVIEKWSSRASLFLLAFIVLSFILWQLAKLLVPILLKLKGHLARRVINLRAHPFILAFSKRYPRAYGFIKNRFLRQDFIGWPLSVLLLIFLSLLILFGFLLYGVLDSNWLVLWDKRLNSLFLVFRDPWLLKFFAIVSNLASLQTVIILSFLLTLFLWLQANGRLILAFLFSLGACQSVVYLLKVLIDRARPNAVTTHLIENTASFPSGHSSVSVFLYGFITYLLVRYFLKKKRVTFAIFCGLLLPLLIGFSRLYLGVHYVSDVLGGYLIGFIFLLLGIMMAEWLNQQTNRRLLIFENSGCFLNRSISFWLKMTGGLAFAVYLVYLIFSSTILPASLSLFGPTVTVSNHETLKIFKDKQWPITAYNLSGKKQETLSLVIYAKDDLTLINSTQVAGWYLSDRPTISSLLELTQSIIRRNGRYSISLPLFWRETANDLAFDKIVFNDERKEIRERLRLWRTDIIDEDSRRAYLGVISWSERSLFGFEFIKESSIILRDSFLSDLRNLNLVATSSLKTWPEARPLSNFDNNIISDGRFAEIILP